MRFDRGKFETYHLTCMVCGALPGTTCLDEDYQELPQVHPSRRMSIGERNWRSRQGWEPPELVEQRQNRPASSAGERVEALRSRTETAHGNEIVVPTRTESQFFHADAWVGPIGFVRTRRQQT